MRKFTDFSDVPYQGDERSGGVSAKLAALCFRSAASFYIVLFGSGHKDRFSMWEQYSKIISGVICFHVLAYPFNYFDLVVIF